MDAWLGNKSQATTNGLEWDIIEICNKEQWTVIRSQKGDETKVKLLMRESRKRKALTEGVEGEGRNWLKLWGSKEGKSPSMDPIAACRALCTLNLERTENREEKKTKFSAMAQF